MVYKHYFAEVLKNDLGKGKDLKYYENDILCLGELYWEETVKLICRTGPPLCDDDYRMPFVVGKEGIIKALEIYADEEYIIH